MSTRLLFSLEVRVKREYAPSAVVSTHLLHKSDSFGYGIRCSHPSA
jgi:hypothetical protein